MGSEMCIRDRTFNLSVGGTYQLFNNWSLTGSLGATRVTFDEDSLGAGLQNVVDDGQTVVFSDLQATYTGFKDFITVSADAGTTQQIDGTLDNQQGITLAGSDGTLRDCPLTLVVATFRQTDRIVRTIPSQLA